jgi:hypothetical protein
LIAQVLEFLQKILTLGADSLGGYIDQPLEDLLARNEPSRCAFLASLPAS